MKKNVWVVFMLAFVLACGFSTPLPPITASLGAEFTLAPGQSAMVNGTDIEITLVGVPGDGRCPLLVECAMSGPVTVTIAIKAGTNMSGEFQLTNFTDNDGRVPSMDFEGMSPQVELNGYSIRMTSVLPFPQRSVSEIADDEYRVTFIVSE